jgi:hypothetical protein
MGGGQSGIYPEYRQGSSVLSQRPSRLHWDWVPYRFPDSRLERCEHLTTLVNETNYQGAKAGEGQIFTFVQASERYVRVYATGLRGAGNETGYRIQLAEVEVYG